MKNPAASVRQRLLNLSREQQRPFQEVLQFFVMERFLYRLSQSNHADRFILKGALMLQVWDSPLSRPTMDIDMLGRIDNDPETLLDRIRDVLELETNDDGIEFNVDSLTTELITEHADYEGVRIHFNAALDTARIRMQLDIGFGDVVTPQPTRLPYPVLLEFPVPELLCYSRESTIAEKFQTMASLGALNSRMKDFYDIWLLSRQFNFEPGALKEAISATFGKRGTQLAAQDAHCSVISLLLKNNHSGRLLSAG
ncbi:MAG: nucleotidyl transferase AbiEii/AbiGii toxin family protein [Halioglobus sp.]|nr:nucleotidyl transferase AbiEii/AbiGii toxin family protein [Halioglobus sp.]